MFSFTLSVIHAMRFAVLLLLALGLLCASALALDSKKPCKAYKCKPPSTSPDLAEFRERRNATLQCLMAQVDANGDGKVTEAEFTKFKEKKLGKFGVIARWYFVKRWCNCDCDSKSISWEDIEGTERSCLYSDYIVNNAYDALCAKNAEAEKDDVIPEANEQQLKELNDRLEKSSKEDGEEDE